MTVVEPRERLEAVLISGPDRGRIVTLREDDVVVDDSPEIEALLVAMTESTYRMAADAREIANDIREMTEAIRSLEKSNGGTGSP